ncbi:DUF3237 family protein [Mangrovibacterium marinum]|uniref:UPF0311 protein C8N47_12816 n=1 Tax=Mangrovibacterium marinum TaxID=1639118 RepID=A0A2T5BXK2_9BACT|nr:DUF3237 family protein [Mangrovibacterium marinum]PTN05038.1 uncharacterized protein DUF3237 [Mangrovibacterium marinum]
MNFVFQRNRLGTVLIMLLLLFISWSGFAQSASPENGDSIYLDFKTELMWKAKVRIGNVLNVGESKRGTRRMIPITGGTFSGPKIKGEVLPYGEDWQLVRPDGDTELNACYLLKTDDGILIRVANKALMHTPAKGEEGGFYVKSVIELEAPSASSYDYLNHAIFIGTLEIPELKANEEPYVVIGVYKVL